MRRGYTLIEVLVTVTLFTLIAAILAPVLFTGQGAEKLYQAEQSLKDMTDAIVAFNRDVSKWPSTMSQLVDPIQSGQRDICGTNYLGLRTRWNGPYWGTLIPAGGLPVGIGTAQNAFGYRVETGHDVLTIVINDVEESDAIAFNAQIDGDDDASGGVVQWSAPTGGVVTATWNMPIQKC